MKFSDGWYFPAQEKHLPEWMANPKARMIINGRAAYQGKKQLSAIAQCAARARNGTAVDVGAHIGLWSFNLATAFRNVIAFEPVAEHRACFMRNVDAVNVELKSYALGMAKGSVTIRTEPTSSGDSWVNGAGDIPMETLDSFDLENVDFIKVDCEGYEENVLRGAINTLTLWRPIVCVEQKRDMATDRFGLSKLGAVQLLLDMGYTIAHELSGDYIMVP